MKRWKEKGDDEPVDKLKIPKATWMADGTHWPGTWTVPAPENTRGDHASIIQVRLLVLKLTFYYRNSSFLLSNKTEKSIY
jgi:hypothetical protein